MNKSNTLHHYYYCSDLKLDLKEKKKIHPEGRDIGTKIENEGVVHG